MWIGSPHPGVGLAGQDWPEWDGEQGEPRGRRVHVRAGVDTPGTQETKRGFRRLLGNCRGRPEPTPCRQGQGQALPLSGGETKHKLVLTQLEEAVRSRGHQAPSLWRLPCNKTNEEPKLRYEVGSLKVFP